MKEQNQIFRANNSGGGLYIVQLISAAVLLKCTEWGTTKQRSQTDSRVELNEAIWNLFSSSFLFFKRDTKAALLTLPTMYQHSVSARVWSNWRYINTSVCSLYSIFWVQSANPGGNILLVTNLSLPGFCIDCRPKQQWQQIRLTCRKGDTKAHLFWIDFEKNRLWPLMELSLHSPQSFKRQLEVLSELGEAFLFSGQYPSLPRWNGLSDVRFFPQTIYQAASLYRSRSPRLLVLRSATWGKYK